MRKEIEEFIEMVEQALHRARNGEALPLYLQAIENLTDKPQYKALKASLEKKPLITDEMVKKADEVFYNNIRINNAPDISMKAALEAVFDIANAVPRSPQVEAVAKAAEVEPAVAENATAQKQTLLEFAEQQVDKHLDYLHPRQIVALINDYLEERLK